MEINNNQYRIIDGKEKSFIQKIEHLFLYKELLFVLALKEIKVKYAQTFMGFAWAFVNPIFTVIVLTFVFKKVANVDVGEVPHTLFTMTGLIGWSYFSTVIQRGGSSLIGSQDLVKKIYFPRIFIPLSKAISALLNFLIVFACLIVLLIVYGVTPSSNIIYLPLFILMTIMCSVGISIWVSALSIRFRDLLFVTPIILRLGMFITPIAYSVKELGPKYKLLYYLNPMTGIVEAIRWSILDVYRLHVYTYISFFMIVVIFLTGIRYFNYMERKIADII